MILSAIFSQAFKPHPQKLAKKMDDTSSCIAECKIMCCGVQADSGGMVSPSGLSYVGRSKELLGRIPAAIAVKRTHLDEAIAMCAKKLVSPAGLSSRFPLVLKKS